MPVVSDLIWKTPRDLPMKDYQGHLETLRKQAAESALISALTTLPQKRQLFARHAKHLNALAVEVERAMVAGNENASASTGLSALLTRDADTGKTFSDTTGGSNDGR
jgi:hypothetical protein